MDEKEKAFKIKAAIVILLFAIATCFIWGISTFYFWVSLLVLIIIVKSLEFLWEKNIIQWIFWILLLIALLFWLVKFIWFF